MRVQRLAPNVAMVTGHYTWNASYAGHPIAGSDSGWRVKIGQVTPVMQRAH